MSGGKLAMAALLVVASCGGDGTSNETAPAEPATSQLDPNAPALEETSWTIGVYGMTRGVYTAVLPQAPPILVFESDGKLTGFTGCHDLNGSYETEGRYIPPSRSPPEVTDGQALSINVTSVTEGTCPLGFPAQQNRAIIEVLENVDRWSIAGGRLYLIGSTGAYLESSPATDE